MEMEKEKVCRSCLKVDKQMKNIFEEAEGRLPLMIKDCTSIKVMPNDGLPNSLCSECEEKLTSAFEFRQFFKNNDQALRAHLNVTVKEDHEDETHSLEDMDDVMVDNYNNEQEETDPNDSELDEKLKYKCDKCPKSFNAPRALSSHKTKMHEAEDPDFEPEMIIHKDKSYKCSHCDMKFSRQHLLMKHQRELHLEVSLQETDGIKLEVQDEDEDNDDDDEDDEEEFEEDELDDDEGGKSSAKKEYPCDFCDRVLTTSMGLKIHRRKHTGKNIYECTECDKSFSKCRHMKNHLKVAHGPGSQQDNKQGGNKREMQCEFCDRKFKYKKSFTQHMSVEHSIDVDEDDLIVQPIVKRRRRTVHEKGETNSDCDSNDDKKPPGVYKCVVCHLEFTRSNHLSSHMTMHSDVLTFKCNKCVEVFLTDEQLQKHLVRHATKPYNCFACSKLFFRGEPYICHIKTHVALDEDTPLQCPICPEQFPDVGGLAEHAKVHLAGDKKHVCSVCGKTFNRGENLRTHFKTHKGEPQIPKLHLCIYCGKEFNNSSNMIVHMRRHTGERPYKCKQCGKGFPRSHDLKCHERTHSGEKPYLCTLCGKSFNKSNKLLRHTRVHTGERPYVCSICGRAFTQSNDLALHMRRHTGARPYACGVCPARFIQSGQLKAHQRSKGHWVETAPDLKGSYRVEPVISTGESKPIRFRRTASGHKYEPPDFSVKPPPLLEQQQQSEHGQNEQQPASQLQTLLIEKSDNSKKLVVPVSMAALSTSNNVHLVHVPAPPSGHSQNQAQTVHMEYSHAPQAQVYEEYGKVPTETIVVVPVLSHTPTSTTGSFQKDNVACSENSNAFSPAETSYECRSYS